MNSSSKGTWTRPRWVWALHSLTVLSAVGLAWVGGTRSHFYRDDMMSLFYLRTDGFWAFLVRPLNVQFVPLHRAATAALDALFGFRYEAHIVVLLVLHLLGLYYLRRVLVRTVGDSAVSAILMLTYGAFALLGIQFIWFSSGLHRFPYALCSWAALDQWLSYRRDSAWRRLGVIGTCTLAAAGFYAKGVLLPLHIAAFEVCLWAVTPTPAATRRRHAIALLPLMLAAGCLGLSLTWATGAKVADGLDVAYQLAIEWESWKVLAKALFGIVQPDLKPILAFDWAALLASVLIGGLVLWSAWKRPTRLAVWAVLFGCLALNVGVLGLSNRGAVWGPFMAHGHRYYLDLLVVAIPMVGLALSPPRWPAGTASMGGRLAILASACAVLLAAHNLWTYSKLLPSRYGTYLETRAVFDRMQADLARLRETVPPAQQTFQNELMPLPLLGMTFDYRSVKHLAMAMGEPLDTRPNGRYLIENDGRIVLKPQGYDRLRRQKAIKTKQEAFLKEVQQWLLQESPPQ